MSDERVKVTITATQAVTEPPIMPDEWQPTRWWRVIQASGEMWAETSNEEEASELLAEVPGGKLQRLYEMRRSRWVDIQ